MAENIVRTGQLKPPKITYGGHKTIRKNPPPWILPFLSDQNISTSTSSNAIKIPKTSLTNQVPRFSPFNNVPPKGSHSLLQKYFLVPPKHKRIKTDNSLDIPGPTIDTNTNKLPKTLNIAQWNIRSISKVKLIDLLETNKNETLHVICIQETWNKNEDVSPELEITLVITRIE